MHDINLKNLTSQSNIIKVSVIDGAKNKTLWTTSKNLLIQAKKIMNFKNVEKMGEVVKRNFKNLFAVFSSNFIISNKTQTSEHTNYFSTSILFTMLPFPNSNYQKNN
jgi:hypothetical protein